jgi:hypothetical protein
VQGSSGRPCGRLRAPFLPSPKATETYGRRRGTAFSHRARKRRASVRPYVELAREVGCIVSAVQGSETGEEMASRWLRTTPAS